MGEYLIDLSERPCYCKKSHIWMAEGELNIVWFCSPTCAAERVDNIDLRRTYEELGTAVAGSDPDVPDVVDVVAGVDEQKDT